ncbi:hypothetical protein [Paenibacillus prosopidis]|uniref:Uncharacterized protein n=1 Tax=Paenibacillus prosopidis TaxID=630520 RepID=A0A368W5K5_9BACL|nr:hypothetical protein [Paenibacillus prosopidis]RCW49033.1 hypothetical protein DFP97_105218 [Paenibacillus prosopidis]
MEVIIGQVPINLNELKQNLFTTQSPADGILSPGQPFIYRVCKPAFPVVPRSGHAGEYYYGENYDFPYELEIFTSLKNGTVELIRGKDYLIEEVRTDKYTEVIITPLIVVEQQSALILQPIARINLNHYSTERTFGAETITLLPTVSATYFESFLAESTSTDILRSGDYMQASLSTILQSLPAGSATGSFPIKTTMPINGKPTLVTIHSILWEAYKKPISTDSSMSAVAPSKLIEGQDFEAPDGLDKITSRFLFHPQTEDYEAYASAKVLTECNGVTETLTLATPTTTVQSITSIITDILGGFDLIPDSFHALQPGQPLELKTIHKALDLSESFGTLNLGALSIPWKITGMVWELNKVTPASAAADTPTPLPPSLGKDFFLSDVENAFKQKLLIRPIIADSEALATPQVYELKGTVSCIVNGILSSSNPITLLVKQLPLVKEQIQSLFQVKSSKPKSLRFGEQVLIKLVTPLEKLANVASPLAAAALPDLQWFPITGDFPIGELSLPLEITKIAWSVFDGSGLPLVEGEHFRTLEGLSSLQTSLVFLPPLSGNSGASSIPRKVQATVTAALNGKELTLDGLNLTFLLTSLNLVPFKDKILSSIVQTLKVTQNANTLEPGSTLTAELTSTLAKATPSASMKSTESAFAIANKTLTGSLPFVDEAIPFELPVTFSVNLQWNLYKQLPDGKFVLLDESEFDIRSSGDTSLNPWKDSRLDVLILPQIKGFHQLAEIDLRYLEAAIVITVPTLDPLPVVLPKIPITQIPIAVPELLMLSEHRLSDLEQPGDRLIILPESTISGLTNWDLLKPVLETANNQLKKIYGLLDGIASKAEFLVFILDLQDALGHTIQPVSKIWVVEAVGDYIPSMEQLPKTDHYSTDDDEWDDEASGFVAILPANRKIRVYEDDDSGDTWMDIIPSKAQINGHTYGNMISILVDFSDKPLVTKPVGTLEGSMENDDIDSLRFLDI